MHLFIGPLLEWYCYMIIYCNTLYHYKKLYMLVFRFSVTCPFSLQGKMLTYIPMMFRLWYLMYFPVFMHQGHQGYGHHNDSESSLKCREGTLSVAMEYNYTLMLYSTLDRSSFWPLSLTSVSLFFIPQQTRFEVGYTCIGVTLLVGHWFVCI